ncbi:MAG: triose-phosphate isomerase family protein [Patescibacteria group bacterium]
MPRRPLVIANWKMNLTVAESQRLATAYRRAKWTEVEVVIAPTAPALSVVRQAIGRSRHLWLAGQDSAWADRGAYTGEVSPLVLKELGCHYVILGHSERKTYFHETIDATAQRLRAALAHDLIPVVCVGESEAEHRDGRADQVVSAQVETLLADLPAPLRNKPVVISYEPFWTISTSGGKLPSRAELQHRSRVIWQALINVFGHGAAVDHCRVIYGGTINATTAQLITDLSEISGALVGSAAQHLATLGPLIKALTLAR